MRHFKFNSFHHFLSDMEEYHRANLHVRSRDSINGSPSWNKSTSFEHALEIAKYGEKTNNTEIYSETEVKSSMNELTLIQAVSGQHVDIGEYLMGIPECMRDYDIANPIKFVDLLVDVAEPVITGPKEMMNRATAIASQIDNLESDGHRVRVSISMYVDFDRAEPISVMIPVKDYSEVFSIEELYGALHPATFRRLLLGWMEKIFNNRIEPGYGHPSSLENKVAASKVLSGNPEVIFMPSIHTGHQYKDFDLTNVVGAIEFVEHWIKNPIANELMGGGNQTETEIDSGELEL